MGNVSGTIIPDTVISRYISWSDSYVDSVADPGCSGTLAHEAKILGAAWKTYSWFTQWGGRRLEDYSETGLVETANRYKGEFEDQIKLIKDRWVDATDYVYFSEALGTPLAEG